MTSDDDVQYHVTLAQPARLKLTGLSTPFIAFDATVVLSDNRWFTFVVDRIIPVRDAGDARMLSGLKVDAIRININPDAIVGIIAQPFTP